jgi:hypothetical protein
MQQHDIAGPDPAKQLHRVRGQHPRVMTGRRCAQGPSGTVTVDLVVQAFGDREELGVAGDHKPANQDVEIADVPDQHLQHLSDPAAGSGRVDVPNGAPGQLSPNLVSGLDQAQVPLATDDGLQQRDGPPWHFHHLDQAHGIPSVRTLPDRRSRHRQHRHRI